MDKNDIFRILDNPDFIPGIYNYCDRWCERCTMTTKCGNYALEKERFPDEESKDIHNEKFWNALSDIFKTTMEMILEDAEKRGINLSQIDDSAIEERKAVKKAAKDTEIVKLANKYGDDVDIWFDNTDVILKEKEQELRKQHEMEIPGLDPVKDSAEINDVIDVIRWYQHQIYVKLIRAVTGKLEGMQDEFDEDMPKDYDGSAKVALLGIDRSIAAWGAMMQHIPAEENSILDILVLLERLRKKTETFFPDARSFKRPGFD
jgi:hypothetical protein